MFEAKIYRLDSLVRANIPEPEGLIVDSNGESILTVPSMTMIFAKTGVGKSLFTTGLALAIASGKQFLLWKAPKPRRVLYIDGEMPQGLIRKRCSNMADVMMLTDEQRKNFAILARDWQDGDKVMPRLDTPEGNRFMRPFLQREWNNRDMADEEEVLHIAREHNDPEYLKAYNPEVVIIDNMVSLFDPEGELDIKASQESQEWLVYLRGKLGITTILVHHAGWDDNHPRGNSSRIDLMDNVLKLGHDKLNPPYDQTEGCRFQLEFQKGRSLFGDTITSFEARYNNKIGWTYILPRPDPRVAAASNGLGRVKR